MFPLSPALFPGKVVLCGDIINICGIGVSSASTSTDLQRRNVPNELVNL